MTDHEAELRRLQEFILRLAAKLADLSEFLSVLAERKERRNVADLGDEMTPIHEAVREAIDKAFAEFQKTSKAEQCPKHAIPSMLKNAFTQGFEAGVSFVLKRYGGKEGPTE